MDERKRGAYERNKASGDKTDKKKAVCGGESGSRSRAVQRDGSAPPRFRSVLFCLSVGGVRLVRRPRAQRAGDGAASAAPSAQPPTCIYNKRTPQSHNPNFLDLEKEAK